LTETIWQTLAWENDSILAARQQEKIIDSNNKQASDFQEVQAIVTETRFITKALRVSGTILHYQNTPQIEANASIIKLLARLKAVTERQPGEGIQLTSTKRQVWLDIDKSKAKEYVKELNEKRSKEQASIKQLESRLNNKNYVQNAPEAVVEQTKDQLQAAQDLLATLETEINRFSKN
jgi:valyl-tRNA synthetase